MFKIMVLTGSDGNPRSFPPAQKVELEETYPYILRDQFKEATFWQFSIGGNVSAMELLSQPMGYLTHWKPDIIIVQAGIVDARPEAFSEFQKKVIEKLTWKFFGRLKRYVYDPNLIKHRQLYRVPKNVFRSTIKKFKMVFPQSKILWLEINAGDNYEKARPGFNQRIKEYNAIIKTIYGEDFIPISQQLRDVDGYNSADHVHLNKRGHAAVADILVERVHSFLQAPKGSLK